MDCGVNRLVRLEAEMPVVRTNFTWNHVNNSNKQYVIGLKERIAL